MISLSIYIYMHMYNYKIEKYLTCLNNEIGTVRVKQVGILIMEKKQRAKCKWSHA